MATDSGTTYPALPTTPAGVANTEFSVESAAAFIPSVGTVFDVTAPIVTLLSPTEGELPGTRAEARFVPVTIRITDSNGLRSVMVVVSYVGDTHRYLAFDSELADNNGFVAEFVSSAAATSVVGTTQRDVTLLPVGGWPGDIEAIRAVAYDRGGNIEAST
jgi:hypothetical protein